MNSANVLLTKGGKRSVCVIDRNAYPGSLPEILTQFDNWVSAWNELRANATYLYEINFDNHTVRGWQHVRKYRSRYTMPGIVTKSIATMIWVWLPEGWKLNRDKSPVRFPDYGISMEGSVLSVPPAS